MRIECIPFPTPDQIERFWSLVDRSDPDGCWPWRGRLNRGGYGVFRFCCQGGDVQVSASRMALMLVEGWLPGYVFACHSCDNRPCCRPSHLFAGDAKANAADRNAKGRSRGGRPDLIARRHQGVPFVAC